MEERELKERMLRENEEFRRVFEEHRNFDRALEALRRKSAPSEEDLLAEKELKKKKLALKDRMYLMMAEYRGSV
jgi:uncharacterized protein YdcH (DUF465 family)